jgi:hypothetical protein
LRSATSPAAQARQELQVAVVEQVPTGPPYRHRAFHVPVGDQRHDHQALVLLPGGAGNLHASRVGLRRR